MEERQEGATVTYGFGQTESGKEFVAMFKGDQVWALFTVKAHRIAEALPEQIKEEKNIDAVLGEPYDWKKSLANHKLQLIKNPEEAKGIYVNPSDLMLVI